MAPIVRMGSFIFKWEHPADEVYVTGSFDDWSKSERLDKINNVFTKEVILPIASDKIYYKQLHSALSTGVNKCFQPKKVLRPNIKVGEVLGGWNGMELLWVAEGSNKELATSFFFIILCDRYRDQVSNFVVDGNWVTDHTAPQENDESGNLNNFLIADKIKIFPLKSVDTMSLVTADSTTLSLAGEVPLVKDQKYDSATLPGTFPVTPGVVERSESELGMEPVSIPELLNIPAATDEEISPPAVDSSNDVQKKTDKKPEAKDIYSISPLPAFPGAVNPISIAPGEKLPDYSTLTSNTLVSSVKLNDDKHRQSDRLTDTHSLINPASTPRDVNDVNNEVSSFVPETPKDTDPISILPIQPEITENFSNSPFIQSVGPQSTTAILASGAPITNDSKQTFEKAPIVDSQTSTESGALESEKELKSTSLDQDAAESSDTKISYSPKSESKLSKLSSEQFLTTDNIPEIIKDPIVEPIVEQKQSVKASKTQQPISPEKEIERELTTEEKSENLIEDSTSSAAPQDSLEPTHTQATPQCTTTIGEATSTDEKNTTSGSIQDTCQCNSSILNQSESVNNESTANDKNGKKKKRLSIFGKLKAKLISKDKD